ncbi:helix-turn-helix domain-containing protein [Gimesia maris]|uniref:helix-turn-helix domain-containing protein n=1 Tax=Gimesia maris TaxID=122 RepID=UPI003A946A92
MSEYSKKKGEKLTYQQLSEMTGISKATLEAIGSRPEYNTTLSALNTLCKHLECTISDLLEYHKD